MVANKAKFSKRLLAAGAGVLLALVVLLGGGPSVSEQASLNAGSMLVVADGGSNIGPPGGG